MSTAAAPLVKIEPADWGGSAGDRWASNVDHFETMLARIGDALLAHAAFAPGERVVEIGCGGGALTRRIAQAVGPDGSALGLDIAAVLTDLAAARAAAEGIGNVAFETGDAQVAIPAAAPFDRLTSRFGVMFFADPAAAMANLHAMLRPGGRADFAVWAPIAGNVWAKSLMGAGQRHLGLPAPVPRAAGPFAFSDPDYFGGLLAAAGFASIEFSLWEGRLPIGAPGMTAEQVAELSMVTGSLAEPLQSVAAEVRDAIRDDLADMLRPYLTDRGVLAPASVHLVTAIA